MAGKAAGAIGGRLSLEAESPPVLTQLPPETQRTLAGFWSHAQPGMTAEFLADLVGSEVTPEVVRGWIGLVAMIPLEMLRPTDPPASHWHTRLARFCQTQASGPYGLRHRVHHCLHAGMPVEAGAALTDFDYLYQRMSLGPEQARFLWQETRSALDLQPESLLGKELAGWESFWRGRQFLVDEFRPQLTFLALADGYAEGSPVSQAAEQWLERSGPEHPWLRCCFRPPLPYHQPFQFHIPLEDSPPERQREDWVTQILITADGSQAITAMRMGAIRVWDLSRGESLWEIQAATQSRPSLALSGPNLAVHSQQEVTLWDLQKREKIKQFPLYCPGHPPIALAGNRLFVRGNVSSSASLQIFDLELDQPQQIAWLPGLANKTLSELVVSPGGRRVTAIWEGQLSGYDLDAQGRLVTFHPDSRRPWGDSWADGRVRVTRDGPRRVELHQGRALLCPSLDELEEWCEGGAWAILRSGGRWHCWNLDDSTQLAQWGPPQPGTRLLLSPKGELLVQASFAGAPPLARLGNPERVRVDSNMRRALTWNHSTLTSYDLDNGHQECTLTGHRGPVFQAALSRDGRHAVSVSADRTLRVWQLPSGKCVREVPTDATAVGVNCDGSRALTGGKDGRLRLWDLREGTCLGILEGHDEPVQWACWTDDNWLISGDQQCFRIWDERGSFRAVLERPAAAYFRTLSPCGRFAYCERSGSGRRGRPTVRDLDRGHSLSYLDRPEARPSAAVFTPDGGGLVVATQEGEQHQSVAVRQWEVVSPTPAAHFRLPLPYNALACDGRRLIASCKDRILRIWDLNTPAAPGHDASVLTMHREERQLVTGSIDKTARVWDLDRGACLQVLGDGQRWVQQARICGDYVETVSDEGVFMYDLKRPTRQPLELFPEVVGPDGRALAQVSQTHLRVWNPRTGGEPMLVGPHMPQLECFALSIDGQRVVTAGSQGDLKIWSASSGECLSECQTPAGTLEKIGWVEEDLLLLEASDGRSWSWDVERATGTRLAGEPSGTTRYRLEFGNQWKAQPLSLIDVHSGECLARWPLATEHALMTPEHQIVAALQGGELAFLQFMPAGPLESNLLPALPEVTVAAPPRAPGRMQCTPLERLAPCQRVLLVGTGGRSDMLAALPLFQCLRDQGKEVTLAGLIAGRKTSNRKRFVEVSPSQRKGARFEQLLAAHVEAPVLCFPGGGTLNRLETFRDLLRYSGAEALVLVEAGVETLLRGDEPSLGTPAEDLVSLAAAHRLELPVKMLVHLGMGIDRPKGVCLAYTLEAIAELTQQGGFWGSLTLLPAMKEFQFLSRAIEIVGRSDWSDGLLAANSGRCGGDPYISPLMNLMWFFDLDAVARRSHLLEWLEDKITPLDVHRALTNFLTVTQPREWMDLPI